MITKLLLALVITTFLISPVVGVSANTTITANIVETSHHYYYSGGGSSYVSTTEPTTVPTTQITTIPTIIPTIITTSTTILPTAEIQQFVSLSPERLKEDAPKTTSNFTALWIFLIIIIIVILGAVAYVLYKNKKKWE
jgi:nitric oxide reductase large subunit